MDSNNYILSQEEWSHLDKNLCSIFGVDYTQTPYNPPDIEPTGSNFDWTGLKHSNYTKSNMRENWDKYYRNPETFSKYSISGRKKFENPDFYWNTTEAKTKQAKTVHELWNDPTSGYHNLKKKFVITDPNGKQYIIQGLKPFCREHGLESKYLSRQANGRKPTPYKGWVCKLYSESN